MALLSVYAFTDLTSGAVLYGDNSLVLWSRRYPAPDLPADQMTRTGVTLYTLDAALPQVAGIIQNLPTTPDTLTVELMSSTIFNNLYWGNISDRYRSLVKILLASSFSLVPCSINLSRVSNPKAKKFDYPQNPSQVLEELSLEDALAF